MTWPCGSQSVNTQDALGTRCGGSPLRVWVPMILCPCVLTSAAAELLLYTLPERRLPTWLRGGEEVWMNLTLFPTPASSLGCPGTAEHQIGKDGENPGSDIHFFPCGCIPGGKG